LLLESQYLPSSTDCWAIRAKKAKTAVLVAVAAKPEVEIWRRPQKWTPWPWFPIHSFRHFFARTHRFCLFTRFMYTLTKLNDGRITTRWTGSGNVLFTTYKFIRLLIVYVFFVIILIYRRTLVVYLWFIKMVELSDPKGPYQEGISNSIFIIPGIIIVVLVGMYPLLAAYLHILCRVWARF